MIVGFKCKETRKIFEGMVSRRFPPEVQRAARRKLMMLHHSADLNDLRVPPGNRLEALLGDRQGSYSIRVNARFRICFVWQEANATADEVEMVDYH
ncbi:MAG: type II toxin-antitoxin system RelE/ParE family toxin [Desulfarculaceae bacterium]|nr:type II toxin-antitoxin system RelE/ParE family toxin [Desulfarculaceae bacterium]